MSLNDTTLALNTFITCTVLANCKLCYDPGTQIDLFQGLILGLFYDYRREHQYRTAKENPDAHPWPRPQTHYN
jgi:hypothetical protein